MKLLIELIKYVCILKLLIVYLIHSLNTLSLFN
jgi:hypothetical protein